MNGKLKEKGLLPLEDLIKALDEKGIEYDKREISSEEREKGLDKMITLALESL